MSLLTATGINVAFHGRPVLRGVDLPALEEGRVLGVIGPNAAGKSTLLRCLTGELRAGEVRLDGTPQQGCPTRLWRRRVAYMPQTPPEAAALTPIELLVSAARALELGLSEAALHARLASILNRLEIQELALTRLSALSGGQRQLVGFALALAAEPRLLVLDEPTSALDLRWRLKLLGVLREIVSDGRGAVAVLHDLDLAARYCDVLVLLHEGRVLAAGAPEEVLTEQALAAAYRVRARVERSAPDQLAIHLLAPLDG